MKFLDINGVTTLWNKIKSTFVKKETGGGIELTGDIGINITTSLVTRTLNIHPVSISAIHSDGCRNQVYLNGPDLTIIDLQVPTTANEGIKKLNEALQDTEGSILAFGRVLGPYNGCSYIAIGNKPTSGNNTFTIIIVGNDQLDDDYSGAKGLFLRTASCYVTNTGEVNWIEN